MLACQACLQLPVPVLQPRGVDNLGLSAAIEPTANAADTSPLAARTSATTLRFGGVCLQLVACKTRGPVEGSGADQLVLAVGLSKPCACTGLTNVRLQYFSNAHDTAGAHSAVSMQSTEASWCAAAHVPV